jgi:rhodanese-related sulfurtransferase
VNETNASRSVGRVDAMQDSSREPLRIDPAEAAAMVATGEAIVLDVVSRDSWQGLPDAVAGALRIPPDELDARRDELPRPEARAIVAYCT